MNDWELLREYARNGSEEAFATLVNRHLNLVYSAALRQVRSRELAEEIAQSVFLDLARSAARLKPDTVLPSWLYQVTRRTAVDALRKECRRQARERTAMELTAPHSDAADWQQIEPWLDEAMEALEETERATIILRYFQNKSLREVGRELGTSDDAAQKRVSRAVDRLREHFGRRGVTVGASGLVLAISTYAVQSAPVGLGATVTSAAVLSTVAAHHATAVSVAKTITMTTMQKGVITVTLAAALGAGFYEASRATHWRRQSADLQQQTITLAEDLRQEQAASTSQLALARAEIDKLRRDLTDLPKLRGELAQLRNNSRTGSAANPTNGSDSSSLETEAASWLARVGQLKQHAAQMPEQTIPEFELLSDKDWLNAARDPLKTDEDYRNAMRKLRGQAEGKFAGLAKSALTDYLKAHNDQSPHSVAELQPFFKSPVNEAILNRYVVVPQELVPNVQMGDKWIITQLTVVEPSQDLRHVIGPNGTGSTTDHKSMPINVLNPAIQAYMAANQDRQPTDPSQLLPFATSPEQQELLQQALKRSIGLKR